MPEFTVEKLPDTYWTEIISPKNNAFDLKLKDVWRYRDLLILFVKRDFAATYKQTVLGPVWHLIQPVLTTFMFLILFGAIANIPTDGIPPILFYMSSLTIWNYFSMCLVGTSNTFVTNAPIFGKVYFPRLIIPLSVVLSNMIKFIIQFCLLMIVMIYYMFTTHHIYIGINWLLIPFLVIVMAALGLGLGIIISSATTKYRDLTVLVAFGVQLLMYATPVAYPLSYIISRSKHAWILMMNPLTSITEAFRFSLFNSGTLDWKLIIYSLGCTLIFLLGGAILFNRVEKNFMDTV